MNGAMISVRPRILIKVTFLKHFALEVWVSIFNHQGDNQHILKKQSPFNTHYRHEIGLAIFLLQQLKKAIKHGRILYSNIRPCIK